MNVKASVLVVRALREEGAKLVFGIPGTQDSELYDVLERSPVTPVLATDERGAAFMADAVSRSSGSVGVVCLVPGAGVGHALSGVAEAWMDNVPLVVLCCGPRRGLKKTYQIGEVDQLAMLRPVVKEALRAERSEDVYPFVRRAFHIARSGCPGPAAVEIPADFYSTPCCDSEQSWTPPPDETPVPSEFEVNEAAELLNASKHPALYFGAGARGAARELVELAEKLSAPVVTTLQGKGVFPEDHPLWAWNGFSRSAPSFVRQVLDSCDCLLAVGCRFSEAATGGFDVRIPKTLVHVDADPAVLNRNYPARLAVASDAKAFLTRLLRRLKPRLADETLRERLAAGHRETRGWRLSQAGPGVNPAALFDALQAEAREDCVWCADSGNGAFLAAEHLLLKAPGRFLAPVDFSGMGYAVPAAVGAKLALPDRDVVAVEGDGALLMTGLELLTAAHRKAGVVVCLLRDGELGQVARFQKATLERRTLCELPPYEAADFARLAGCAHVRLDADAGAREAVKEAFKAAREGRPVILEAAVDPGRETFLGRGMAETHFWRLPLGARLKMTARLISRRLAAGESGSEKGKKPPST